MPSLPPSFWQQEDEWLYQALLPLISEGISSGVETALLGGIAVDMDTINHAAFDFASKYTFDLVGGINDTSAQWLEKEVSSWIAEDLPLDDLTNKISEYFDSELRGRRIAVTETTRSFAEGNLIAWGASPDVYGKRWQTGYDEIVCDVCAQLHGQPIELSEQFHHEGIEGTIDAADVNCPPAHVECRCYLIPVTERSELKPSEEDRWTGGSVEFYEPNEGIYDVYGWKPTTDEQRAIFMDQIHGLNPDIARLWTGDEKVIFAINPEWINWGMHQSHWIVLGTGFDTFPGLAQHEFIHAIVSQGKIGQNLIRYSPSKFFNHAARYPDRLNRLNEDLTIMLDNYSRVRSKWVDNILSLGEGITTRVEAEAKIDTLLEFFEDWVHYALPVKILSDLYSSRKGREEADRWKRIRDAEIQAIEDGALEKLKGDEDIASEN